VGGITWQVSRKQVPMHDRMEVLLEFGEHADEPEFEGESPPSRLCSGSLSRDSSCLDQRLVFG
jgi:hypothetical protein